MGASYQPLGLAGRGWDREEARAAVSGGATVWEMDGCQGATVGRAVGGMHAVSQGGTAAGGCV
ncbi:MAG TPA: hypothetical protein VEJ84_06835, partial [Acidimicrobiales bacterium]|nr:hypothetical protein [Acidimicrobiales bacterium]